MGAEPSLAAHAGPFAGWSSDLLAEFAQNTDNPRVGTRLVLEDERCRVWEIRLAPGERLAFHRHVLDSCGRA